MNQNGWNVGATIRKWAVLVWVVACALWVLAHDGISGVFSVAIFALLVFSAPVSYTHLDVYKRQLQQRRGRGGEQGRQVLSGTAPRGQRGANVAGVVRREVRHGRRLEHPLHDGRAHPVEAGPPTEVLHAAVRVARQGSDLGDLGHLSAPRRRRRQDLPQPRHRHLAQAPPATPGTR